MRVFIRHAAKTHRNGQGKEGTYSLDPEITEEGRAAIASKVEKLVQRVGKPSLLVSSPFLRTRQTSEEIARLVGYTDRIHIDRDIGEYLGHQPPSVLHDGLEDVTASHQPHHDMCIEEMDERLYTWLGECPEGWYVTHGLVIKRLAHHLKVKPKFVKYLTALVIDEKGKRVFFM